jgi:hypothetical protein
MFRFAGPNQQSVRILLRAATKSDRILDGTGQHKEGAPQPLIGVIAADAG